MKRVRRDLKHARLVRMLFGPFILVLGSLVLGPHHV